MRFRLHEAKADETLVSIAQMYYGDPQKVVHILQADSIPDTGFPLSPENVKVLVIPLPEQQGMIKEKTMQQGSARTAALLRELRDSRRSFESLRGIVPQIQFLADDLDLVIRQLEDPRPMACPRCGGPLALDEKCTAGDIRFRCACLEREESVFWIPFEGRRQLAVGRTTDEQEEIPEDEEIATLPHWALVAFAARCARRLQPLFRERWPEAPLAHQTAVEAAIRLAEECAGKGRVLEGANAAVRAAKSARDAVRELGPNAAASAAANAARAAATDMGNPEDVNYSRLMANSAARDVRTAAFYYSQPDDGTVSSIIRALRRDFDLLRNRSEEGRWNDDTPVAPDVFDPMWLPDDARPWGK